MSLDDLTQLAPRDRAGHLQHHDPTRELLVRGRVSKAPLAEGDEMHVILKNYTGAYPTQVAGYAWTPHHDGSLPADQDHVLVAHDDDGDAWVVAWG